ncbi:carbohydrate kinase family protein [Paenibacillus jilunlii]|uniref:Fructokinase n=1 Tax=Paenibacillus jilunlii TaxID=682956 RepID=A0A1G9MF51_9BACL|nr:sugar kinase [Paenibacillus jilunlii]KWX70494.1 fructokinase [Paenibacillus jilunlii]SDL72733.1 fructokinase [Paenibacillus jilunlii]
MIGFNDRLIFENKSNDLLAAGELLVDMISNEYDDTFQSAGYTKFPGGSPSNIAINVRKLGISSVIVSAVGEDGFGKFLVDRLRGEGLETQGIQRNSNSTSLVVVSKSKSTPVPIFYRGADYHLAYTPMLDAALKSSRIVHFSCWPVSRTPSRQTIERMIEEARKEGMLIGFDPNYHSAIWQEGEDGVQYVKDLISKVDIIKPSEDDAERLFGRDTPYRQLEKFLELGAKLVILTLGENGAIVSNGRETRIFETLATDVVDTTGAGDAFWSGFYTAAVKGYTLQEALNLGFAVSAFKLKYTGAVVDLPKIEDIQAYYNL